MNKKKVKLIILFSIVLTAIFIINHNYITFNHKKNITEFNGVSIYIQNHDGEHEIVDIKNVSLQKYKLNNEKSNCENGSIISWNEENQKIEFSITGSDNCNIYFDIKNDNLTLADTILFNNGLTDCGNEEGCESSLVTAMYYLNNRGEPNFFVPANSNQGVFKTTDINGGNSYYFRGAVNDNWVYFAGFYWRIIRIDEDGNIKMIYSGTTAPTVEQSVVMLTEDTSIGTSYYNGRDEDGNYIRLSDENFLEESLEAAGYVYSENNLHGSTTDSEIKKVVDAWYNNNLKENYESYLAKTTYCVDRTASLDSNFKSWIAYPSVPFEEYEDKDLYMGSYERIENYSPSLNCKESNDKINLYAGLISADEAVFAGATDDYNDNEEYYLFTDNYFWTLSPQEFDYNIDMYYIGYKGGIYARDGGHYESGIRPVISLNSENMYISGNGTYNNPYIVVEE